MPDHCVLDHIVSLEILHRHRSYQKLFLNSLLVGSSLTFAPSLATQHFFTFPCRCRWFCPGRQTQRCGGRPWGSLRCRWWWRGRRATAGLGRPPWPRTSSPLGSETEQGEQFQKMLSHHFKFFKMYQYLHSHRAWIIWKACNSQGQCAQGKGGIRTELALSISSDLIWHFDWSWKSSLFSLTLFYSGSLFGFTCKFVVTSTLRVWKRVQNFWPKKFPPNNKRSQNAG